MGASKGVNLGQRDAAIPEEVALVPDPGTGPLKQRMAGELLTDLGPMASLAEESSKVKYSANQFSKAPTSQYLGQSSRSLI